MKKAVTFLAAAAAMFSMASCSGNRSIDGHWDFKTMNGEEVVTTEKTPFLEFDGESGRTHWGLTAQNVKAVMDAQGITDMDFAGWTRAPKTERTEDGGFREIPGEYEYGLRYAEFIAPLIAAVQSQKHEIDALRAEIDALKNKEV